MTGGPMDSPQPTHFVPNACRDRHVLVTGGAGFIGSHLVEVLTEANPASLTVVDSFFLGKEENLVESKARYPDLVVERMDASDFGALRKVVERQGTEIVFDLATIPLPYSLLEPLDAAQQNLGMAMALCELARLDAYQTLVHFSTSEVYGTAQKVPMAEDHPIVPLTPYAASKAGADHIVMSHVATFGIDAVIVRPFNTYGPRQNEGSYAGLIPVAVRSALAGEPVTVFGDGRQTRDWLFVADAAKGALQAHQSPASRGKVFNLASGVETSVLEIVETIYDILGEPPRINHETPRPGDVRQHRGSSAAAEALFGFSLDTSLRDGLAATVDWYRSMAATGA